MMSLRTVFEQALGLLGLPTQKQIRPPNTPINPVQPSGFAALDRATGLGGLPQGQLIELLGPGGPGQLSVAARIAARFQRRQQPVWLIDMPGEFEAELAARCGLTAIALLRHQPTTAADLMRLMTTGTAAAGLILLNLGNPHHIFAGAENRHLQLLLQRWQSLIRRSPAVLLCLSTQEVDNPFSAENYPPGLDIGRAAALRLWLQDEGWVRRQQSVRGYRGNITVIKNNLAVSGQSAVVRVPLIDPAAAQLEVDLGF